MNYQMEVDRLFKKAERPCSAGLRVNPVTGGHFTIDDSVRKQKRIAMDALKARDHFKAAAGVELPLSREEQDRVQDLSPLDFIRTRFAQSLSNLDFRYQGHPEWEDYVRGVMALPNAPDFVRMNPTLRAFYPPLALPGLGSGMYFERRR